MKVFYSWQSDLPNKHNRGFIQKCLNIAIKNINGNLELQIGLDKDTQDVEGSPDIANTILDKICNCDIFVADISIINLFEDNTSRRVCNPNVLIELGFAAAKLGWENIVMVFNLNYGRFIDLPFDIRHRRPLTYALSDDNWKEKKQQEIFLASYFESIIYQKLNNKKGDSNHIVSKIYPFFQFRINNPFNDLDRIIFKIIDILEADCDINSIYPLNKIKLRDIFSSINEELEPKKWNYDYISSYKDERSEEIKEIILNHKLQVEQWFEELLQYQEDLSSSLVNSVRVVLVNLKENNFYSNSSKGFTGQLSGRTDYIKYVQLRYYSFYEYAVNIHDLRNDFIETYGNYRDEYIKMKSKLKE